jgi:integrase
MEEVRGSIPLSSTKPQRKSGFQPESGGPEGPGSSFELFQPNTTQEPDMPSSTTEPADRIITRFLRSHRNDWSDANIASATWHLNRAHAWLEQQGIGLVHDDVEELADALDDYIAQRLTEVKANSVIVDHRQLAAFYRWAAKPQADGRAHLPRNPMLHVTVPQGEDADPADKPVAVEWQYDALLATTRRRHTRNGNKPMNDRRDAAIIALLWHTGMRRSEIAGIDYDRIDFETERIFLPRTKGGRRKPQSRWVPIPEEAMELLDLWIDERGRADGPLFPSATRDRRLAPNSVTLMLRRRADIAARTLGIPADAIYTPAHSFRRSSAIAWLDAGGSEVGLMRNHGWRTRKMIDEYTDPAKDDLTAAEARRIATARAAKRHLRAVND